MSASPRSDWCAALVRAALSRPGCSCGLFRAQRQPADGQAPALLGHLGWQRRGEDGAGDDGGDTRVDAQVGLGIAFEPFDLRIAWSQVSGRDERARQYPIYGGDDSGWIVTLSRAW
jgi:hypothetical protein